MKEKELCSEVAYLMEFKDEQINSTPPYCLSSNSIEKLKIKSKTGQKQIRDYLYYG